VFERGVVTLREGRIAEVREGGTAPSDAGTIIQAEGLTVAPGLIDIHVHGAVGYDTMDATPEAIQAMARFFASHGVTSFLATTMTADRQATLAAIRNVASCLGPVAGGAEVLGLHLEGPYVNDAQAGAQRVAAIRPAEREEYEALFEAGPVRLITLAPEVQGNRELIPFAMARGAAVAIGHSQASYEEVLEAVALGLSQATHTFNGMPPLHHRQPGPVGAVLSCDALRAQVIVDLVHIHPAVVKLIVRAKGVERTILVTDAMRAAGLSDGTYDLGGQAVMVKGGEARLASGRLAGSTLTLDRAVRNAMAAAGLTLPQALQMATLTPAQSLGLAKRKGSLEAGKDADIILLDEELEVVLTMVGGAVVYRWEGGPA
jgi:N-acetylglucosamine-6-phosphate deacetylase